MIIGVYTLHYSAMSEEQLTALLARIKGDAGLQEKLKGAADLDAAMAIAKEAGFDLSNADWIKYQEQQTMELSDEELKGVSGGAKVELYQSRNINVMSIGAVGVFLEAGLVWWSKWT